MFISKYEIRSELDFSNGYVEVHFEDYEGEPVKPITFSKVILEKIKTEEPSDATTLRDTINDFVAKEILLVFVKNNIGIEPTNIEDILRRVITSIQHSVDSANDIHWGNKMHERTMLQLNDILLKNAEKKEEENE